jgi:hypothetical protein
VKQRRMYLAAAAMLPVLGLVLCVGGCSDSDGNEFQRLVCEVSAINEGVPLVSGYLNAGSDRIAGTPDDFLPIDYALVEFHARPYSSLIVLPEDAPHSYFHVTRYDLIWHPASPGSEPLVNYDIIGAGVDVLVPVNEEAEVAILVADRYMKEQPFYSSLYLGAQIPFTARAELRFYGHETGNEDEVMVTGSFMVSFVGVVIDD